MKTRVAAVAAGLVIALTAGCSGPTLQESLNPTPGQAGCKPASPAAGPDQNFEIQGTPLAKGATASGLFFEDNANPAQRNKVLERKFVVRVSGEGELGAELVGPSGKPSALAWGPEPHEGGDASSAGEEWDMGLKFDDFGCWNLTLTRDEVPTAAFWFEIG